VTRLSDLSGSLSTDIELSPYLTCYPLLSAGLFALAKTWPDLKAARSGCVLTHTLFLPIAEWRHSPNPQSYEHLFRIPVSDQEFQKYSEPLAVPDSRPYVKALQAPPSDLALEFVSKYFGEGLRPILWFGADDPESIMWSIIRALWPNLRSQFACCTLSLQPRSLQDRPFDLLFSPKSNSSRFHKIPRENVLDPQSMHKGSQQEEPWLIEWASEVFSLNEADSSFFALTNLSRNLGEEPTSIKKLFLAKELYARASSSATAALGLLDLVDSLSQQGSDTIGVKEPLLDLALSAISKVNSIGEAAEYYYLLDKRLARPLTDYVKDRVAEAISSRLSDLVSLNLETVLNATSRFLLNTPDDSHSAFVNGVIRGVARVADKSSGYVRSLCQYPEVAQFVLSKDPKVALGCLKAIQKSEAQESAIDDLIELLRLVDNEPDRDKLRDTLLPEVSRAGLASVADELLRDIAATRVQSALVDLTVSPVSFSNEEIRRVVEERLVRFFPKEVLDWAKGVTKWTDGVVLIVAECFKFDESGLDQLLNSFGDWSDRDLKVISAFIHRGSLTPLPFWLRRYADNNPKFIVDLLMLDNDRIQSGMAPFLESYVREVQHLRLSKWIGLTKRVDQLRSFNFSSKLFDCIMRDALVTYLEEDNAQQLWSAWEGTSIGKEWLNQISIHQLQALVSGRSTKSRAECERLWNWLLGVDSSLFARKPSPLPRIIESISVTRWNGWEGTITISWRRLIQRASKDCDNSTFISLCAQALAYSFAHNSYPLSELVVEVFHPVYQEVIQPNAGPETSVLFDILDWDKGKELRRQLVKSFMGANWPPGDLALAVRDEQLLRKVYKRVMRRSNGLQYVEQMIHDLRSRKPQNALALADVLEGFVRDPNFHEDWD